MNVLSEYNLFKVVYMVSQVKNIVIVGGGTAGWITAGLIASKHLKNSSPSLISITIIESPDIASIGVGEGTWPSMRETLRKIGVKEAELIQCCDASFKQASKFINWEGLPKNNSPHRHIKENAYYHPFTLPAGHSLSGVSDFSEQNGHDFANTVCAETVLCENNLAPKLITTKAFDYIANYGYHIDATKFSELLKKHCVGKLGVKHIISHVMSAHNDDMGDIQFVSTQTHGDIPGDLFIDCSGAKSLLLGKHYSIPFSSKKSILFNDKALAVQLPYQKNNDVIASCTLSTAQSSGWIWDIGLQSRRGVGYTYSSNHITDDKAEIELIKYIQQSHTLDDDFSIRKLSFNPGYYEKFWHKNCVAVGMSAGFIEPLEASALAMIEQAASMISEQLPATKKTMPIVAKRFNKRFTQQWQQIIEFLKLHYVLSKREDSDYWIDNREKNSIPDSLQEMLALWKHQAPSHYDIPYSRPLFPAASYQYVLYGMHFKSQNLHFSNAELTQKMLIDVQKKRHQLGAVLQSNRDLINKINQYGLADI
jgi:flavin-dependent dehydrogenase